MENLKNKVQTKKKPLTKKKSVCIVIDSFDTSLAGVCVSAQRFVKELQKNYQITVVTTGNPGPNKVILPSFSLPLFKSLAPFDLAWPKEKVLSETIRQCDLVHVQLPTWLGRKAVKIANQCGVPCIGSIHRQPENFLYPLGMRWQKLIDQFYKFEIKNFYSKCRHIICPSAFAKNELLRYGLSVKTSIVSNGIDPFYCRKPSRFRQEHPEDFIILTVGRLSKEKCHEIIIKAVSKIAQNNPILLIIVGKGEQEGYLQRMARDLNLSILFLTSGISDETLRDFYNAADLFVHAGSVELECLTVLEAMACGITPLISDASKSAASQFALDDRSLFQDKNTQSLQDKISYWMTHDFELKKTSQQYLEESKKYLISRSVSKLESIYELYL